MSGQAGHFDEPATPESLELLVIKLKERNIGTGVHFKAAHLHAYYAQTGRYPRGSLPQTEWASERLFSIPLFPKMTEGDVRDVVAAIKDVIVTRRSKA